MSTVSEINTEAGNTEYKQIIATTFTEVAFEIAKYALNGWDVVKEGAYPFQHYNGLFEVNFVKNAATIRTAAEKVQAAVDGKGTWGRAEKVENMAKARAAKKINKEVE